MLLEAEIYITLFGAGTSILSAIGQLVVRNKRKQNYNLAVVHLSLGILLVQCASVFTGFSMFHPWLLRYHLTLIWAQAPLLYLAYVFLVVRENKFPDKTFRLFIPTALAFIIDTSFIIVYRDRVAPNLFWGSGTEGAVWVMVKQYLLVAGGMQIILYLLVFIIQMVPLIRYKKVNIILVITLGYCVSTLISTVFMIAGYISADPSYMKVTAVMTALALILIYPLGQRQPKFYQMLQTEVKERRYKKYLLAGQNVECIMEQMASLMEEQMLFTDETLTLKMLADRLSITPHQLSQLLNDKLNTNFSNYINQYRIREAQRILIEEPDRSVLTIAFEVGFNNKTSFYDAFSRFNNVSPHKYRKEKLRKK